MADLDTRLHNIETSCAPSRDNSCLHRELNGLSLKDMMTVTANYVDYATNNPAAKSLPVLDLDALLTAIPGDPNGPGNLNAFKFHERY